MANIAKLLTEHMAIWTAADTVKKSGRGRASGNAGSAYGVKKLRELILELAVRGKLVRQNPNDEPAKELLNKIELEKKKQLKSKKIRNAKTALATDMPEVNIDLPQGWSLVRIAELLINPSDDIIDGPFGSNLKATEYITGGGVPIIRIQNIDRGIFKENGLQFISESKAEDLKRHNFVSGDVVLNKLGEPAGKTCIVPQTLEKGVVVADIIRIRLDEKLHFKSYFVNCMNSPFVANQFSKLAKGVTRQRVNLSEVRSITIPIAPLAEQHRIVAKVDELMALCDQLEQQHSNSQEAHESLVSQLLATFTQSQNAAEFNNNWQRIYTHFDVLFTTEASIDALKQTLLQLAVMGKLVPQDLNDEPANELLKRIQAQKAKLIAEGKLKKEKPLAPIGEGEKLFELPKGWEWTTLLNAAVINPRNNAPDDIEASFVPMTYIGSEFSDKHQDEKRLWKDIKQGFTHFAEGDIGVAKITPCFENSKACVFENLENGLGAGTTELHIVRPVMNTLSPRYVLSYLKSPRFLELGESKMTGTAGQKRLPKDFVESNPFPLPPIAEQHRIVAKVDALMALCDQLKTRIQQANQQQRAIADALVVQALRPHKAEVIDLAEYRKSLICYVINAQHSNPTFGRTQAEKVLAFSQNHIGSDIELQFSRKKAGPYSGWMEVFEAEAKEKGWISVRTKKLSDTKYKYEYGVNSTLTEQTIYFVNNCPAEQKQELDRLLKLFENLNTEQAEIIATLFCAWNDFLINGDLPTDDEIICEVRENWHPSKERFSPEQLTKWLNWLRENNIVPTGKGSKTIKIGHQKKLIN
jgi:type I restriction enzyme, S subunit